jgi:hypothetical protein
MKPVTATTIAILALMSIQAESAVMVEMQDSEGLSRIYSEGGKGRIEMSASDDFMLVDGTENTMYMVMPSQRTILDMGGTLSGEPATGSGGETKLTRNGNGPSIAGYETVEYVITAGDRTCQTVYGSRPAMEESGMKHILSMFQKMALQAHAMATQFGMGNDPCTAADTLVTQQLAEIGMPMRVKDEEGTIISEVLRIDAKATLPPDAFALPADYERQDMAQMQQQMREQMPPIQEMMKQMQESGDLPPEAIEHMQRMQEMMKQHPQP